MAALTGGLLAALVGCDENGAAPGSVGPPVSAAVSPPWFVEVAAECGLHFAHTSGATGAFYFPEIAGSGCGLFDYDGDGDLDVYALQAYDFDRPDAAGRGRNRLFRNDLSTGPDGRPRMRFVDVTDEAGLGDDGYGMGCAVGDYDNDGDLDLYVTNFGPNRLYRNNGDGTFTDVSAFAVPSEDRWSTSAAFLDYDRDGALDLYVANYVNFRLHENKICYSPGGRRDYCGPQSFDPVTDRLFHNNGDGTFADVTAEAGIDRAAGSGLGVVAADFNGDGFPDIYVANDGNANQLWVNQGDGTFRNTALLAGAAYNADGMAEAGMGVSASDFDRDGDEDIFLSHLQAETNTLLVNDGVGRFDDRTEDFSLAALSRSFTGFGTEWADLDGDGDLDLFVANGAVKIVEQRAADPYPYGNPNLLLRNTGEPAFVFEDAAALGGPALAVVETSRGAAFGDLDNDGDIDILVSNSNGPLRLLRNEVGHHHAWLALRLVGTASNRSAIGAVVTLRRPGRRPPRRRVHADGSYLSVNDLRVYFGLGNDRRPQTVIVAWPSGRVERFDDLPVGRQHELREGKGRPES